MCHPITLFQLIKPSRPITLSHHQAVPILSRYSIPPSCPNHITPSFAHPIILCHLIKLSQSHHPILLSCPYPILSHHPISSSSPHPITSSNIIKLSPSYHIIPSCPYPIKLSHTIKLSTCYHHFISSSCPDAITSSHIIKISSSYHIIRSNQAVTSSHLINLSTYYHTISSFQTVTVISPSHIIKLSTYLSHYLIFSNCTRRLIKLSPVLLNHPIMVQFIPWLHSCQHPITGSHVIKLSPCY